MMIKRVYDFVFYYILVPTIIITSIAVLAFGLCALLNELSSVTAEMNARHAAAVADCVAYNANATRIGWCIV